MPQHVYIGPYVEIHDEVYEDEEGIDRCEQARVIYKCPFGPGSEFEGESHRFTHCPDCGINLAKRYGTIRRSIRNTGFDLAEATSERLHQLTEWKFEEDGRTYSVYAVASNYPQVLADCDAVVDVDDPMEGAFAIGADDIQEALGAFGRFFASDLVMLRKTFGDDNVIVDWGVVCYWYQ